MTRIRADNNDAENSAAATGPPLLTPGAPSPVRARRRTWCFRIMSLCFPFAALALLELALTWGGFGKDLRLVEPAGGGAPSGVLRFNGLVDKVYYGPMDLSGPEPRPFHLPRPTATFRIVVVGGSTVFGFPYPPELAFPRFLEISLREQGLQRDFEVLNAGITAINSFAEADLVEQALACEPNLIVVYTGHNEFVGPGGVGSKFGGVSPRWFPALLAWRRTRLHQSLVHGLGLQKSDNRQLSDQLPGDLKIPLHGAKFRQAEQNFRSNLQRIVRTAVRARVPVLLTTPITNLRHQSPLESLSREGLSAGERQAWQQALDDGKRMLAAGRHDAALEAFDRARAIDDGSALLAFRRGQALQSLHRPEEALAAYQLACDLDACRFRAPSDFARIIAQVAADAGSDLVHFLDTASLFAEGAPDGIPGDESLLEHVHLTYAGNWRLALVLAEHISREFLRERWRAESIPDAAGRDRLCGAMPQDHLVSTSLVLAMLERPPMNQGPDVAEQIDALASDLRRLFAALSPHEQEVFGNLSLKVMQADLVGELFGQYESLKMEREEGALLQRGILRQPWRVELLYFLAELEIRQGAAAQARIHLDQAEKWKPRSALTAQLREHLDRAGGHPNQK